MFKKIVRPHRGPGIEQPSPGKDGWDALDVLHARYFQTSFERGGPPKAPDAETTPLKTLSLPTTSPFGARSLAATADTREIHRRAQREALTQGTIDPALAARIESILGVPLVPERLLELYQACLPGTHAMFDRFEVDEESGAIGFGIQWLDSRGVTVSHLQRSLHRESDDSLTLTSSAVFVDANIRGRGTSARVLLQEVALLRALSTSENTCIRLGAGGMHGEMLGPYVWAQFGFDFDPPDQLVALREKFRTWFDAGATHMGERVRQAVHRAIDAWKHPWEIANFYVRGFTALDSRGEKVDLGKAFMIGGHEGPPRGYSARWTGVFRVNDPEFRGTKIGAAYAQKAIQAAALKPPLETATCAEVCAHLREKALDPECTFRPVAVIKLFALEQRFDRELFRRVVDELDFYDSAITFGVLARNLGLQPSEIVAECERWFMKHCRKDDGNVRSFVAILFDLLDRQPRELVEPLLREVAQRSSKYFREQSRIEEKLS